MWAQALRRLRSPPHRMQWEPGRGGLEEDGGSDHFGERIRRPGGRGVFDSRGGIDSACCGRGRVKIRQEVIHEWRGRGRERKQSTTTRGMFLLPLPFVFLGLHPVFFIDTAVVFFFFCTHSHPAFPTSYGAVVLSSLEAKGEVYMNGRDSTRWMVNLLYSRKGRERERELDSTLFLSYGYLYFPRSPPTTNLSGFGAFHSPSTVRRPKARFHMQSMPSLTFILFLTINRCSYASSYSDSVSVSSSPFHLTSSPRLPFTPLYPPHPLYLLCPLSSLS